MLAEDTRSDRLPSREAIVEGVKQVVAEQISIPAKDIRETSELEAELGCDSLDLVEITMEIEEHFGIDVPDEVHEKIRTVGDIADGVERLLAQSSSQ